MESNLRPKAVVEVKPWYTSKMLWANVVAMVAGVGTYISTGDLSALYAAGLGLVNFLLRLVTRQPLE